MCHEPESGNCFLFNTKQEPHNRPFFSIVTLNQYTCNFSRVLASRFSLEIIARIGRSRLLTLHFFFVYDGNGRCFCWMFIQVPTQWPTFLLPASQWPQLLTRHAIETYTGLPLIRAADETPWLNGFATHWLLMINSNTVRDVPHPAVVGKCGTIFRLADLRGGRFPQPAEITLEIRSKNWHTFATVDFFFSSASQPFAVLYIL